MKDKSIGTSFDDFLEEEGIKEEVTIEAYKKVVEVLKADRLELANAIVDNWKYSDNDMTYCKHCSVSEDINRNLRHGKDCIVLKAEKIIEEIEK